LLNAKTTVLDGVKDTKAHLK